MLCNATTANLNFKNSTYMYIYIHVCLLSNWVKQYYHFTKFTHSCFVSMHCTVTIWILVLSARDATPLPGNISVVSWEESNCDQFPSTRFIVFLSLQNILKCYIIYNNHSMFPLWSIITCHKPRKVNWFFFRLLCILFENIPSVKVPVENIPSVKAPKT